MVAADVPGALVLAAVNGGSAAATGGRPGGGGGRRPRGPNNKKEKAMKARIPTNIQWTAANLIVQLQKLDPATELVFGSGAPATAASTGTNKCWCGCGSPTKSKFAPGHDARFHGEAKKAARGLLPVRREFVNDEARADWFKWFEAEKAEIARKAIPVVQIPTIGEIEEIEEISEIEDVADVDASGIDEATDAELLSQLDEIG
jgi:hypothetical protein